MRDWEIEILAPKVTDYSRALSQARTFETTTPKQIGSTLSWYLKGGSIYQQSELAKAGAKRLSEEILPPDR
jgi:hypothetical protein